MIAKGVTILLAAGVAAITGFGFVLAISMPNHKFYPIPAGVYGIPCTIAIAFIRLITSREKTVAKSVAEWLASGVFVCYAFAALIFFGGPVERWLSGLLVGTVLSYWGMRFSEPSQTGVMKRAEGENPSGKPESS